MKIGILGATGAVGSTLLVHLLKGSDLVAGDEIVLVGRGSSESMWKLLAMKADLLDAFDAGVVSISVSRSIDELEAVDLFIMAAGASIDSRVNLRSQLAERNLPLFWDVAERLAKQCPDVFVFLISNPVELAVQVFCNFLDRKRVLGIGAQQDSLRFARAIAFELNLPRAAVRASVLGEHGENMVPLWSSVYVVDGQAEASARLENLRDNYSSGIPTGALATVRSDILKFIETGEIDRAYLLLQTLTPDLKILIEPLLTVKLLQSTPNATANATLDCIAALRHGDDRKVHGQVLLEREFYELKGVLGVPLVLRRSEWRIGNHLPLAAEEISRLREVNSEICNQYEELLQASPLRMGV